jgi:orotate phosphoribosyltransferase
MEPYQESFIEFALEHEALRFGEFTLKSGRTSPYFFNTGFFDTGRSIEMLGQYYGQAIIASRLEFDMLFGPAYKGIPLATTIAIALARNHDRDLGFCFNRKETKDHGERGITFGAPLRGRALIVDDVITAGTSVNESVAIIRAAGADPIGVMVALDRQEQGKAEQSAFVEVARTHGLSVHSIVKLDHIIEYLGKSGGRQAHVAAMLRYQSEYGV